MKRFLIAVSISVTALSAFAQGSINSILQQVAQNNLTLQSLRHEQEAAVFDRKAENVFSGPSVEYSPFFSGSTKGVAQSELVVSEEFDFPTKYAERRRQTALLQDVNSQEYNTLRRNLLLEAQLLCLDVIRVNQTLVMLNQRLESNEVLRQMFAKRMEAGDANALEVNKVSLDCMEVQTLVSEAENARTQLLQQLQQLNGGKTLDVTATEQPEYPQIGDYATFEELALASDAEVLAAEAALKSATYAVSVTKKSWLPNLTFGYRRNTEIQDQVNGVLLGVSFPVLSTSNRVKAAKRRQQSAALQAEETRQAAEAQLRSRYQQLVSLQQVLDHSDVKMMNETLELLSKALQHGEITALQYYTEINSIYEKLQRHIDVHCQSVKLLAELHKYEL